jgi:hypothetical protein
VVLDAINVKTRDGQVADRPIYAAIGVDPEGLTPLPAGGPGLRALTHRTGRYEVAVSDHPNTRPDGRC